MLHNQVGWKFYLTRDEARKNKQKNETVHNLGVFSNGSFGLFKPGNNCNQVVLINVWATVPKG